MKLVGAILLFWTFSVYGEECSTWFKKSNISAKSTDCEAKCSSIRVDMGTFDRSSQWAHFCNAPKEKEEKCNLDSFWKKRNGKFSTTLLCR